MTSLMYRLFGNPQPCRGGWRESEVLGNCSPGFQPYFPLQPLNTWSNVAYGLAGVALLWLAPSSVTAVQASCLGVLMIGSGLYHGWPCERTNLLDHAGMASTFAAILATALGLSWPLVLGAAVVWAAVAVVVRPDVNLSMAILLGGTWAIEAFPGWPPLLVLSALVFLLSYAVWLLDRYNDGWMVGRYGHAIWHLGTSISLLLMALAVQ